MAAIAGERYTIIYMYVVYRLLAIAAILFYWIRMKVVQQLTCLTLGRPNGPDYLTGELLNTPPTQSESSDRFEVTHNIIGLDSNLIYRVVQK